MQMAVAWRPDFEYLAMSLVLFDDISKNITLLLFVVKKLRDFGIFGEVPLQWAGQCR